MSAGASGYIAKPHSDKLAALITQFVENRERPEFAFIPMLAAAA